MKVLVAGAGQVGFNVARYLATAGNDVTIIDQRQALVQKIGDSLDIQALTGYASHPSVLDAAGAGDADIMIAVTQSDEVNMVACQVAHSLFNVPTKIARVRQQDYLQGRWQDLFRRDHLPIDVVISPEVEVAHAIALSLEVPGALNVVRFADDLVRLIAIRCHEQTPVIDTPLRQLTYLFPDLHVVCVGIDRDGSFFIPSADDQILAGDEVQLVVETSHLARVLPAFGYEEQRNDRIVIAGGGNVGLFLATEIETHFPGVGLKVIETDTIRAELVADQLRRSVVLCGDSRDLELLNEANVAAAEAIVTVTNNDEINIMVALLAKSLGCHRALSLLNNGTYNLISREVGIDVVINPRDITVSTILQHVRRGRIKSVHTIRDGEVEIYEAEALETSPLVGKSLRDLRTPGGMVVGAVIRDGRVLMPRGDTSIKPHDRVIIVARSDMVRKVEQLFAVRVDYF